MRKIFLILFLIGFSFIKAQDSTIVWFKFFDDSVKTYPYAYETPQKYIETMERTLYNIETKKQEYLDWLGEVQLWFVPKELSDQVEQILKRHNLVVKYSRYHK